MFYYFKPDQVNSKDFNFSTKLINTRIEKNFFQKVIVSKNMLTGRYNRSSYNKLDSVDSSVF